MLSADLFVLLHPQIQDAFTNKKRSLKGTFSYVDNKNTLSKHRILLQTDCRLFESGRKSKTILQSFSFH